MTGEFNERKWVVSKSDCSKKYSKSICVNGEQTLNMNVQAKTN